MIAAFRLKSIPMKKVLLLVFCLGSLASTAQNIADNKVIFSYVQLPTNPVDPGYTTYSVAVNPTFDAANEDSLNIFAVRQEAATINYDAQMTAWKEQRKSIDRKYLTDMANWEKATNAGTTSPQPQRGQYPPPPIMEEIREPLLHDELTNDFAGRYLNVEGFTVAEGGVVITIDMGPISEMRIVNKKTGSAATTKYQYTCNYKLVATVKVECPARGIVLNTMVGNSVQTHTMNSYASKYEFELWWMDNRTIFWSELQQKARVKLLNQINGELNSTIGFPTKKRTKEVFSVKRHKDHQYTDLTEAYTLCKQGYGLIQNDRDRSGGADKIQDAISMWEKVLGESTPGDKNSRINEKVTAMIYYNLAEAYMWTSDFDQAEMYIDKAINGGSVKFKGMAKSLQKYLPGRKSRWQANY